MTVINIERLTIRLPELEVAWTRKTDAAESYADAIKAVCAELQIEPGAPTSPPPAPQPKPTRRNCTRQIAQDLCSRPN